MKRAIITPTYKGHFKFIEKYLESFDKYVEDKSEVTLIFTISEDEVKRFDKIISPYKNKFNIVVYQFEDLLEYYNISFSCDDLLRKYRKFSYQTLKKFYTMLYCDCDQMLILDSESMFINPTNLKRLFDDFFDNPFITVCDINKMPYVGWFKNGVIHNYNLIFNLKEELWFLENFVWFYDKKILNNLFKNYGSPLEVVDKIYRETIEMYKEPGCFEICLYQAYIYMNAEGLGYRILQVDELLLKYLPKDYKKYLKKYLKLFHGEFGILEMLMVLLNKSNYSSLSDLAKENKFNIIRCDFTNYDNCLYQQKFLDRVKPNILAASQNHIWGTNNTFVNKIKKLLFYNNIWAKYVYWDLKYILSPILYVLRSLKCSLLIVKHTMIWLYLILRNSSVFIKGNKE